MLPNHLIDDQSDLVPPLLPPGIYLLRIHLILFQSANATIDRIKISTLSRAWVEISYLNYSILP